MENSSNKYIKFLEEENCKLKAQFQTKSVLYIERVKYATMLIGIGLIIGYLILPSPIALLFPEPIQNALKNVSCRTNAVYKKLGI